MKLNTITSPARRPNGRSAWELRGLKGLLLSALVMAPASAHALNYDVTSTADDGSAGTLRNAIDRANATPADDTITFSTAGTITLINGRLSDIEFGSGRLVITGSAAGTTISGGGRVGIFRVAGGNLSLNNLTLRDASGNIGAIANDGGTLIVTGCTLANNVSTGAGGAIGSSTRRFVAGQADPANFTLLRNSTLTGNRADFRGGAIYNDAGLTRIEGCTIVGNSAPSGVGSGVASYGDNDTQTRVQNSIIADNRTIGGGADSGTDVDFFNESVNSFVSQGNNVIGDGNATGNFNQSGDQTGVTASRVNLGALASNGGPTPTLALLAGSVAIDKGSTTLTVDQRGAARPQGSASDVGAYEFVAIANRGPRINNATYTAVVGSAFSQQLAGSDAENKALTYTLAAGSSLPAPLTLSASGLITGTPTTVARTDFSVNVTNGTESITAKFIIVVSPAGADGIGPVLTRDALNPSYTRAGLAGIVYTGTVRDVAQDTVMPVGVKQVLFQLRQGSTAYSGNETAGFTTDLNRGYFPAFLSATNDGTTAGLSSFRRNFGSFIPSNLPAGPYSMVILGQDNLNNFSVEVVPVTITAPAANPAKSSFGVSGSANGS